MLKRICQTGDDSSALVLRVLLGVVMFPHGAQKMLGWFGGGGFSGSMTFFTQVFGIPWILALLAFLAEFLGALGLIAGLLTRVAALGIGVNMVAAALMVHWSNGFFMNWFDDPEHERLLSSWPDTLRVEVHGLGGVLFCHATPRNDTELFTRLTPEERLLPVFAGLDVTIHKPNISPNITSYNPLQWIKCLKCSPAAN
jgi:putative oxidoreductase